jgi:Rrf2 family protein
MKLSTKGRYSIRMLVDLAINGNNGSVFLKDIARRQDISEKYLGHLVPLLKNAKLINVIRGSRGGFSLAKPAAEITLKDIIVAVEGPISLVEPSAKLKSTDFWAKATEGILKALDAFTLDKIAEEQKVIFDSHTYVI